jgi:hypothetical protein
LGENVQHYGLDVCQRVRHSLPDDVLVYRVDGSG